MRFLFSIVFFGAVTSTGAQSLDSTLQEYGTKFRQERIYFHFDKSAYFPGDTIWYKAYLMTGWSTSDISKNLYTDWLDAHGNLLLHGVEPIVLSTSYGQIVIPKNYKQSVFHLHAYTGWMLNFDSSFLFDKDITVIQPRGTEIGGLPAYHVKVSLMPEGGNMVQSLTSLVAFKAENQSGRPINITGAIRNKTGDIIDSIFTEHDGMGKFFLNPEAGESYSVTWKDDAGDSGNTALAPALLTGAVLKAYPVTGKVSFHIDRTPDAPDNFKKMYLVGLMNQAEVCKLSIDLSKVAGVTNAIATNDLQTGILQLTLFDANWKPVAERIVFVNNNDYSFTSKLTATKENLGKRGRNEIEIDVPDSFQSTLSVSVTDAGLAYDSSYNIISHLLLSSQLRGRINNPAYYFSSGSDSVVSALDLVMLTNGWRRYNWDDLLAGKLPVVKYPRESVYVKINGQAMFADSNVVDGGTRIFLNLTATNPADSLHMAYTTGLRDDGTFAITPGAFYDSLSIQYKLIGTKKTENKGIVNFTGNFLPPMPGYSTVPIIPTIQQDSLSLAAALVLKARADDLAKALGHLTLKNVTVTAKAKSNVQVMDQQYATPNFQSSNTGNTYSFDVVHDPDAKGLYSLSSYLMDKIPGLQVQMNGSPPVATYFYRPHVSISGGVTGRVQVYLDELATDDETASSIQLSDIAYVKFYKPGALVQAQDYASLAIYTRQGDDETSSQGGTTKIIKMPGFTPVKEFYSPDYSTEPDALGADVRTTLYWNPNILMRTSNKAKFVFYNNDISKRLRIVLEGMDAAGKLTRVEKILE